LTERGEPLRDFSRLSLNTKTVESWSIEQAVNGCAAHGIPYIALWRDRVAETGLARSAALVRDASLKVSSLCRGGFFPAATKIERAERIDDNRRAVDEAAELGAEVLILVCGPAPDRDIDGARAMVADGVAEIAPYARERGVRLGIEPLHPMFAGDRSVIVTLAEALNLAQRFPSEQAGVVVDAYHVWWDPDLYPQIARAGARIAGFHVNDWLVPLPDPLLGRGMMGDGVIELRKLRTAVELAGYSGPIEVEIFNRALWDMPGDDLIALMKRRFLECL
jgi:sugar phosphate isomerase/epimerase